MLAPNKLAPTLDSRRARLSIGAALAGWLAGWLATLLGFHLSMGETLFAWQLKVVSIVARKLIVLLQSSCGQWAQLDEVRGWWGLNCELRVAGCERGATIQCGASIAGAPKVNFGRQFGERKF